MTPSLPTAAQWWVRQAVGDGITLITEPHVTPFLRCNVWHVVGRDRDLLIDTGLGLAPLHSVAELVGRELVVVATHTHYDHVGGLHEFPERLGHVGEAELLTAGRVESAPLLARDVEPAELEHLVDAGYEVPDVFLTAVPHDGFDLTSHRIVPAPLTGLLDEGDVVDLGDRVFRVLHLPGHSPGSIGLFEEATSTLFSGDAVYDGPLLDQLPGSDVDAYRLTMERLRGLRVDTVHGGHEASFDGDRLVEICDRYLERRPAGGVR